jgi:aspartyl protease family protein
VGPVHIGQELAQRLDVSTATAFVALDEMQLGPFIDRGVPAAINDGQMPHSLMGMSYLSRFGRIEIVGNKMILSR